MKRKISILVIFLVFTILLLGAVKGNYTNYLSFQTNKDGLTGGPFESSNSNSRYALTEAIAKYKTLVFNLDLAKFSSPDVVKYNNTYFTIFTPGVSFIGVPFYFLGSLFGIPQLTTYLVNILVALINGFLIYRLARKLGAGFYPAIMGGAVFLFATNALAYALTFTQHHLSTMILLLALLNVLRPRTVLKNIELGLLFGAGLLIDIPNVYTLLPVILYALWQHLSIRQNNHAVRFSINLKMLFLGLGLIPLLALFGWYNYQLTGSYTKIGQTIGRSHEKFVETVELTQKQELLNNSISTPFSKPLIHTPFNTREQLNGLYILLISNERGWFYFSPILSIGLLGLVLAYKAGKNRNIITILSAVILIYILSYAMFGDPWGGWAFGPRYLIPAAALACVFISFSVQRFYKNIIFAPVFAILITYSIVINSLGALTTSVIPPKVEAVNLTTPIPYTYKYNWQFIDKNFSSSLFYNFILQEKITAGTYLYIYSGAILLLAASIYLALFLDRTKEDQ